MIVMNIMFLIIIIKPLLKILL